MLTHLNPLPRYRLRLSLFGLFLTVKVAGSLYWLSGPEWFPDLILLTDLLAGLAIMWFRHWWFRTPSPYDIRLKTASLLGLFSLIMLHNYHLMALGYPTNDLFFIPVMIAAFDLGVVGGLIASTGALAAVLVLSVPTAGTTDLLATAVRHAILYGGISLVMGRLVDELFNDRERYRLIVEESQHPIVRIDRQGRITLFNQAAETLAAVDKGRALLRYEWQVVGPGKKLDDAGQHTTLATRALELGIEERGLPWRLEGSGEEREFLVDTYLVRSTIGKIAGAFAIYKDVTELKRTERELESISLTDPLTKLGNRRLFERHLQEWREEGDPERSLAVIMLDIDHFKQINDTYGHAAGDRMLRALGSCLTQVLRPDDLAFRTGGEEFTVLLPGCELASAQRVAERIRTEVAGLSVLHEGRVLQMTVSLGVAAWNGAEPLQLVRAADKGLYKAKHNGRNRVCCA